MYCRIARIDVDATAMFCCQICGNVYGRDRERVAVVGRLIGFGTGSAYHVGYTKVQR